MERQLDMQIDREIDRKLDIYIDDINRYIDIQMNKRDRQVDT